MSLGKKLNTLISLVVGCLIISTIITWVNFTKIDKNVQEALDERVEQIRLVDEIRVNIGMQGLYIRALFIANTKENQQLFQEYATKLDENIEQLAKLNLTSEVKEQVDIINSGNDEFNTSYTVMLDALEQGEVERATALLIEELKVANLKILDGSNAILAIQDKALEEVSHETDASINSAKLISIVIVALSIMIALLIMFFIQRGIVRPLNSVMQAAKEIAARNLNGDRIVVKTKDEIGELAAIFNGMKETLRELINEIQLNTQHLQLSAQELTSSTEEISASAEEITSQVATAAEVAVSSSHAANESAVAVDETAKGVQLIAEASQQLQLLSNEAKTAATNGTSIISNANNQMGIISDSTAQVNELVLKLAKQTAEIENISKVISDITDQTNLLALNASIEAARAGEHGKGFAVVADEVKKLANESKDSANTIHQLTVEIQTDTKDVQQAVGNALHSVNEGVKVINNAGESFSQIVGDINEMSKQIIDISGTAEQVSANSEEVAATISEIANGAVNVSETLTSISAIMEEQSAAMNDVNDVALQLNENATSLEQQVKQFTI